MPRSPACSPSSQAQGHTHWFSSRSRVKLELKAGMTKLTWARWTGWKRGNGREGVNWGRPEDGNWGIRETPEQGIALGRGGPSPAAVRIIDLGARRFAKIHLSARFVPFQGAGGRSAHPQAPSTLPTGSAKGAGVTPPLWGQSPGAARMQRGSSACPMPMPVPPCCWQDCLTLGWTKGRPSEVLWERGK